MVANRRRQLLKCADSVQGCSASSVRVSATHVSRRNPLALQKLTKMSACNGTSLVAAQYGRFWWIC
jgi:hypothetical protein